MLGEHAERLTMPVVPDLLRKMLHEVAAAQDVQQLEAAADGEGRQITLERSLEQPQLAGIAVRLRRIGLGVARDRLGLDVALEQRE